MLSRHLLKWERQYVISTTWKCRCAGQQAGGCLLLRQGVPVPVAGSVLGLVLGPSAGAVQDCCLPNSWLSRVSWLSLGLLLSFPGSLALRMSLDLVLGTTWMSHQNWGKHILFRAPHFQR